MDHYDWPDGPIRLKAKYEMAFTERYEGPTTSVSTQIGGGRTEALSSGAELLSIVPSPLSIAAV